MGFFPIKCSQIAQIGEERKFVIYVDEICIMRIYYNI